jgi:hypothetical protein
MSARENRFAVPMIPYEGKGEGAANTFGVLRVDVDDTHGATELPYAWHGRMVRLHVLTASRTVDFALSDRSDAEVDSSVTVANTSTQAKVGMRIFNGAAITGGLAVTVALPEWDKTEKRYLIAEANAANTLLEVTLVE